MGAPLAVSRVALSGRWRPRGGAFATGYDSFQSRMPSGTKSSGTTTSMNTQT